MHWQIACPLCSLHWAFVPQGEGLQGSLGLGGSVTTGCWVHRENGSPTVPGGQLQMGLWFWTSQTANIPQVPGQGSMHFWAMQARALEQSEFRRHSALHPWSDVGSPWYPLLQLQTICPALSSLHSVFGPQGDGLHGFSGVHPCVTSTVLSKIIHQLFSVVSTRSGLTEHWFPRHFCPVWNTWVGRWLVEGTTNIRVSIKSLLTGADWVMIDKATLSVVTAEARTHRNTFSLESVAVLIFGTVRIDGAF